MANAPRRLIVFAGPQDWGIQSAQALISISEICDDDVVYSSTRPALSKLLGLDKSVVVIDAFDGLNPDVVGQASGTIIAGGALVIICPSLSEWPDYSDPENAKIVPFASPDNGSPSLYLARWAHYLASTDGIELDTPDTHLAILPLILEPRSSSAQVSPDQQSAVEAIIKVVNSKRRRPLLITANRGRGKSAALGMAAAELFQTQAAQHIIVTSSSFANARHVFKHAECLLDGANYDEHKKRINYKQGTLQYLAPDRVLEQSPACDLLMVDEAAAVGIHRLKAMLRHYPRIVFASTEHGYEGSGRGFSLKFRQMLREYSRGAREIELSLPIRWHENDPLEKWTDELLLLDSGVSEDKAAQAPALNLLQLRQLGPDELLMKEPLLRGVFRLLVEAHYQTRPNDLRLLLDAPNAQLHVARYEGQIAGLVWVMLEGGLKLEMANEITVGRRRPQGHLAPQIIAAHLGIRDAATLKCARIARIVVPPQWQGRGIGQWMAGQIEQKLGQEVDYLASSYGVDPKLSRFWRRAGYVTVRISDTANVASGLHSALVIKPLSRAAAAFTRSARTLFHQQLIEQLAGPLRDCSPELICTLVSNTDTAPALSQAELEAAVLFSYGQRPIESSLAAIKKIAQAALFDASHRALDEKTRHLFILRCLQHRHWTACAKQLDLEGKAQCLAVLKQGVKTVLSALNSEQEMQAIRRQFGL